jgi:NADH-quinone oxidoreductase subunit J
VTADVFLFWFLAILTVISGVTVVTITNPIYSALALVMTMIGISALFVTLNAYFLAGVQLIIYAGAVTVLFVMVLMLFDLKNELTAFTRGKISGIVKLACGGIFAGLIIGSISITSASMLSSNTSAVLAAGGDTTKDLGKLLFTKFIFGFEALGILLLIVAVGAVSLARSKGGTHAK